jgi:hypothetical protein
VRSRRGAGWRRSAAPVETARKNASGQAAFFRALRNFAAGKQVAAAVVDLGLNLQQAEDRRKQVVVAGRLP